MQPVPAAHVLGGLQVELPGEHRQPRPQQPLLGRAQLMAPADRRTQRLMAGQRVPRRRPVSSRNRSSSRSSSCPGDRARSRPAASSTPAGCRPGGGTAPVRPPVRRPARRPAAAAARSSEELRRLVLASGASGKTRSPADGQRPAPHGEHPEAGGPAAAAPAPARRTRRPGARTRRGRAGVGAPRDASSRTSRGGRRCGPSGRSASTTACSTSSGSRTGASSTSQTPSRRRAVRAAARAASRDLPTPPPRHGDQPRGSSARGQIGEFGRAAHEGVELQGEIAVAPAAAAGLSDVAWDTERTEPYSLRTIAARNSGDARRGNAVRSASPGAIGSGDDFSIVQARFRERCTVSGGEVAGILVAVFWAILVSFLAVALARLAQTLRATTKLVADVTDQAVPLLADASTAVRSAQTQIDRVDAIARTSRRSRRTPPRCPPPSPPPSAAPSSRSRPSATACAGPSAAARTTCPPRRPGVP